MLKPVDRRGKVRSTNASAFHPNVYWADGLEQIERDDDDHGPAQLDLLGPNKVAPPRAVLTRPHVRAVLRPILRQKFNVVVGNPPYITESDPARREYHRQKDGKKRRYQSAYREYSLAAPFIERCLQLAEKGGRIGLIVANNFMKREFGKPLIEEVIAKVQLELVVDTSQAFIPHHGTPTVMLFARNQKNVRREVRAVMGKRGDPSVPADPSNGLAWTSLMKAVEHHQAGYEDEFAVETSISSETMGTYPWSLGPGGVIRHRLEAQRKMRLAEAVQLPIGRAARIALETVFLIEAPTAARRRGMDGKHFALHYRGAGIRDWFAACFERVWFPYRVPDGQLRVDEEAVEWRLDLSALWRFRTSLANRATFQGVMSDAGLKWYEYMQFTRSLVASAFQISFANVATHSHFAFVEGQHVFNSKAPVIKLPPGATEDDHLALLGLLNSSTACFWMKQVFHNRGIRGEGGGTTAESWEQFFEFDATKLKLFPIPDGYARVLPWARELDGIARRRADRSVAWVLAQDTWRQTAELRKLLDARRVADLADLQQMIAVQEELDWECYRLYGVEDGAAVLPPDRAEPIPPNWRPVELNLATRDAEIRATIARGHETTELPTAWFDRHGWQPLTDVPAEAPKVVRELVAARRALIGDNAELRLFEQPTNKRRWYCPDHDTEEQAALAAWLTDRIEQVLAERRGKAATLAQITAALEEDTRVHTVAELLAGRRDYQLSELVAELVAAGAVPDHPFHVYKPAGLEKRKAWERTWDEQRKEDAGLPANPEVPPKYGQGDFLKPEYFRLRGKLDVPKERFVAFTQVPGRGAGETLYGWAGWTPTERMRALLAIDEECEDQGIHLGDRIAVLDSAWRLIPDVTRDDATTGARLKAELAAILGPEGPSKVLLDAWRQKFPAASKGRGKAKAKVLVAADDEDDDA